MSFSEIFMLVFAVIVALSILVNAGKLIGISVAILLIVVLYVLFKRRGRRTSR